MIDSVGRPTFSILTPSFNQASYVEDTLRSVLDQSGDVEIEHIVIDGGSTDGTVDIPPIS
jgi:glycosyltransferase involved in cell wall biosynthesis